MIRNAKTKRIRVRNKDDYNTIIYFIQRDSRSDKKYRELGDNTVIVNHTTVHLLHEIGLTFVEDDFSEHKLT
jgi:hypothetical protein